MPDKYDYYIRVNSNYIIAEYSNYELAKSVYNILLNQFSPIRLSDCEDEYIYILRGNRNYNRGYAMCPLFIFCKCQDF